MDHGQIDRRYGINGANGLKRLELALRLVVVALIIAHVMLAPAKAALLPWRDRAQAVTVGGWFIRADYLVDARDNYVRTEVIGPFKTRQAALNAARTDSSIEPAFRVRLERRP